MVSRAEFSLRPPGFHLTEEEYRELRQERMKQIVTGGFLHHYDEWVLRGVPKEALSPTIAIAIFPTLALTPVGYLLEPEVLIIVGKHRKIDEYWQDAVQLPLTDGVIAYEQRYFHQDLIDKGDAMLLKLQRYLIINFLPSALMLFGRTPDSTVESAYLICPNTIPPSAVHRHLREQAKIHSIVQ